MLILALTFVPLFAGTLSTCTSTWYGKFLVFLGVLVEPTVCVAYEMLNWGSPTLEMELNGGSLLKLRCVHPNIAFDSGIVGLKEETML